MDLAEGRVRGTEADTYAVDVAAGEGEARSLGAWEYMRGAERRRDVARGGHPSAGREVHLWA